MTNERDTQISAFISRTTREMLERFVRATGVKKARVMEDALRHHLLALQQLPADVFIHPRIVISKRSGARVLDQIRSAKPTKALRDLIAGDGD